MELTMFSKEIAFALFKQMSDLIIATADPNQKIVKQKIESLFKVGSITLSMEQQYNLKYPGEVLERYKEHCGDTLDNVRALALALAEEREYLDKSMFIAQQYKNFLQHIRILAKKDLYLRGVLYLLTNNAEEMDALYHSILCYPYQNTREAVFAIYVMKDRPDAWEWIKDIAIQFLGKERTEKAYGNELVYKWFAEQFYEQIRKERKRETNLLKGFLELPSRNIKHETPVWNYFKTNGYSKQEIDYLNLSLIGEVQIPNSMSGYSITAERKALFYCQDLLNAENIESDFLINLCRKMLIKHKKYKICLEEKKGILESLDGKIILKREDVFRCLYHTEEIKKEILNWFLVDFTQNKWDSIIKWIEPMEYRELFGKSLCLQCKEDIDIWLEKYNVLTGEEYINVFWTENTYQAKKVMKFLVNNKKYDILNIYEQYMFEEKVLSEEKKTKKWNIILENIRYVVKSIDSHEIFCFWDYFDQKKGIYNLNDFLLKGGTHPVLETADIKKYDNYFKDFRLRKNFLSIEENRKLFNWIEQTVYRELPEKYEDFLYYCLLQEEIRELFPVESRELFLLVGENLEKGSMQERQLYRKFCTDKEWREYQEDIEKYKEEKMRKKKEDALAAYKNGIYQKIENTQCHTAIYDVLTETGQRYYWKTEEFNIWFGILEEILAKEDMRIIERKTAVKLIEQILGQFGLQKISWDKVQWIISNLEVIEDES